MVTDINIKKIVNAYYCKTEKWKRNFFLTRLNDGVVFFTEGEIEYYFADKKLVAKKGDVLFLPGNIPYSGKKLTDTVAFYVIDFECFSESEFEQAIGAFRYSTDEYDLLRLNFSKIVDIWKKQHISVNFELKSFIYSVLSDALKSKSEQKEGIIRTETILSYIYENIKNPSLSLKMLCDKFFISESQLRRNIYKHTGMNPNKYILRLRLNMSKKELTYSQKSIAEISQKCGFSSPYYFSKCFSEHIGMSPKDFRKRFGIT